MYINNTAVIAGFIKDASRKSCFVDSGLVGKASENSLYRNFYQNTFNIDIEKNQYHNTIFHPVCDIIDSHMHHKTLKK